ncbi:MAG: hypothetical protein Q9187_004704 [Circinaria calcarea]
MAGSIPSPPNSPSPPPILSQLNSYQPLLPTEDILSMAHVADVSDIPKSNGKAPFDIVSTYHSLLAADPDLTMPVAAIEALVLLLSHSSSTTISETLDLLATSTAHLKRSVRNPISLSAGTDLFQRYLITTLQRPSNLGLGAGGGDFKAIRQHLLSNGRLFVKRAKEARRTIAEYGRRFIRDGSVVLTNGGSRVVGAILRAAAEARSNSVRFQVIYVQSPSSVSSSSPPSSSSSAPASTTEGHPIIQTLRALQVPVAVIPDSAVAYSMGKVSLVLVGAEGVVENGGVISRLGTYQMGILAKSAGKPFYVVTESHKFVRLYPLGQYDLPIEQKVLDFRIEEEPAEARGKRGKESRQEKERMEKIPEEWAGQTPAVKKERREYFNEKEEEEDDKPPSKRAPRRNDEARRIRDEGQGPKDAVDYTPPDLITALITESGVHTPSAVSEELIKIWY